ncbi:hypothetical protein F4810DRAFT_684474 [Camillea tinctor]|nr:hypothetical protein F4810DRAFT_684474 [Camillea tinctor]
MTFLLHVSLFLFFSYTPFLIKRASNFIICASCVLYWLLLLSWLLSIHSRCINYVGMYSHAVIDYLFFFFPSSGLLE